MDKDYVLRHLIDQAAKEQSTKARLEKIQAEKEERTANTLKSAQAIILRDEGLQTFTTQDIIPTAVLSVVLELAGVGAALRYGVDPAEIVTGGLIFGGIAVAGATFKYLRNARHVQAVLENQVGTSQPPISK